MNNEHYKILLQSKERELRSNLAVLEGEERVSRNVRDSIGDAAASQRKSESFAEGTDVSQMLEQVQAALHRLTDGNYGSCNVCGRPIEPLRIEAIPWTANCMYDQKKMERAGHPS